MNTTKHSSKLTLEQLKALIEAEQEFNNNQVLTDWSDVLKKADEIINFSGNYLLHPSY